MSDTAILPCPFCGQVPTTFNTNTNGKWGFVQCCIDGPEVRASYAPVEEWKDRAIAEWNDRKPAAQATAHHERLHALARKTLWLAYVWNDHNFDAAHLEARETCNALGIKSLDAANAFLAEIAGK